MDGVIWFPTCAGLPGAMGHEVSQACIRRGGANAKLGIIHNIAILYIYTHVFLIII